MRTLRRGDCCLLTGEEDEGGRPLLAVVQHTYLAQKRPVLAVTWLYRQEDVLADGGTLPPDCRPHEVTLIEWH